MDFGRFSPPFGPFFGSFWAQKLAHFGLVLGPILGYFWGPSGAHFERKHKENKTFWSFLASQKGLVLGSFRIRFWSRFGLNFGLNSGHLLGCRPNPIFRSLGAGLAGPHGRG